MIFERGELAYHAFSTKPRPSVDKAPATTTLTGTFPNPFNSRARVQFELAEAATVQLLIYDTQGRRVATLVDGPLTAGLHERGFDASGLPSGLYFASLKTQGHLQAVKKLLLVK